MRLQSQGQRFYYIKKKEEEQEETPSEYQALLLTKTSYTCMLVSNL